MKFKVNLIIQAMIGVTLIVSHSGLVRADIQTKCIDQWNESLSFDLRENGVFKRTSKQEPLQLKRLTISLEESWSLDLSKDRWRIAQALQGPGIQCRKHGETLLSELDRVRQRRFQFLLGVWNYDLLVDEVRAYLAPVFGTEKERAVLIELEPFAHDYFRELDLDVRKILRDERLEKTLLNPLSETPAKIVIWTKNWTRLSPTHLPHAESHADTQEVGLRPWDLSIATQRLLYVHELAHLEYANSRAVNLYDVEAYAWLRTFEMVNFIRAQKKSVPPLFETIQLSAKADCNLATYTCKETPAYRSWIKFVVDSNYFE